MLVTLLGARVLAPRHDDHLIDLVVGADALFAAGDDLADDSSEKIAVGHDHAAAVKGLLLALAHPAILTVKRRYTEGMADDDPTVLWRMTRGRSTAHATIIPGSSQTTITWFFDGIMDRVENYDTVHLALARADDIKGVLLRDGWTEA
jgi:hypothetical protein